MLARRSGDDDRPRSVQILLWYPAAGTGKPVAYADYFHAASSEIGSPASDAAAAADPLGEVRAMAIRAGAAPDRFDALVAGASRAMAGAEPATSRFPILVFAPGMGAPAYQNTVLCEYLASHGFVVAATASVGAQPSAMTEDAAGLQAQIADTVAAAMGALALSPRATLRVYTGCSGVEQV